MDAVHLHTWMQNKLTKILALCFSTGAKRLGSKRLCSQIFNLYRKRKGVLCERVRVVKTVVNLRSSGADSLAPFQRSIRTGQERIGDTLSELALLASFVCEEREILWRKRECVYGVMGCGKSKSATAPSCKLLKPPLPPLAFANPNSSADKAREAFYAMDKNGDGVLQPDEVKSYLASVGYGQDESLRFIRSADLDGDGQVDFDEFHKSWGFLNAFRISGHTQGEVLRKPGSMMDGTAK